MSLAQSARIVDELTDFLATSPTPQQITAFQLSEELERHALDLLRRNREGQLSAEQQTELAAYMQMDHFMTLLKAKVHCHLKNDA